MQHRIAYPCHEIRWLSCKKISLSGKNLSSHLLAASHMNDMAKVDTKEPRRRVFSFPHGQRVSAAPERPGGAKVWLLRRAAAHCACAQKSHRLTRARAPLLERCRFPGQRLWMSKMTKTFKTLYRKWGTARWWLSCSTCLNKPKIAVV